MDKRRKILAEEWVDSANSDYQPDIPDYIKEEIIEAFSKAKLVKDTIEKII